MEGRNGMDVASQPEDGGASTAEPLAVVFFDFDSTLTVPQYIPRARQYALADNPRLFASMSEDEIFANFGGRDRVKRLAEMLQHLQRRRAQLFIISLGFSDAIRAHLGTAGLAAFFPEDQIYGQDSPALAGVHHRKPWLIARLLQHNGWPPEQALFVDDDDRHISLCKKLQACPCLKVRSHGLDEAEMRAIEARAGPPAEDAEGAVPAPVLCCGID
mmetsp:Transcript_131665/g.409253  ORF Transcript_131665/g.409253 Transcript_131665/m.409253 type:complete len:216 (+) Transcript_131665:91-738(+)